MTMNDRPSRDPSGRLPAWYTLGITSVAVAWSALSPAPSPMNISASLRDVFAKYFAPDSHSCDENSAHPLPPSEMDRVTAPASGRFVSIHSATPPGGWDDADADAAADARRERARARARGNGTATRGGATDAMPAARRVLSEYDRRSEVDESSQQTEAE